MKVVCIGEMLIDFVCTDTNQGLVNGVNYVKKSGGAPANVAACIGKLGGNVLMVASVGSDPYGEFLQKEVEKYHIDTRYVSVLPLSTTFAFVSLADNGEREFAFNRGADEALTLSNEAIADLSQDAILHLGSATALLGGQLSKAYSQLAHAAKANGNIICFDPNFRIDLWRGNEKQFIEVCDEYFDIADIVKVSDEELELIAKTSDFEQGCAYFHDKGVKIVLVTLGGDGCLISQADTQTKAVKQVRVPAYKIVPVDTTGAGDSFIGAILYQMSQAVVDDAFFANDIAGFVEFAGKVSGLVCSKIGAMEALPTLQELEGMEFVAREA
jgi:fructokinase